MFLRYSALTKTDKLLTPLNLQTHTLLSQNLWTNLCTPRLIPLPSPQSPFRSSPPMTIHLLSCLPRKNTTTALLKLIGTSIHTPKPQIPNIFTPQKCVIPLGFDQFRNGYRPNWCFGDNCVKHYSTKSRDEDSREAGKVSNLSWVDVYVPENVQPYAKLARLDKPIGTWLLAWPCMWSITLAAPPGNLPDFWMMTLFGTGAFLLRGAGCTINDLIDRDIDPMVDRTKLRPVASGRLTPFQGLSFLGFQLLLGLGILLQLNNYSRILGASSLLLVFSYPLMKRFTFWPQAYLGLTFNWGALLGWTAVNGNLDLPIVLPLYASGVFWTLVYDTIYAHQDKEDDMKVGVKSTALRFGDSTKEWLTGFGIASISNLAFSGYNADLGWPYYACLALASGHLGWQISTVNLSCRADCNRKFVSNKWFGTIIFSGILLGKIC